MKEIYKADIKAAIKQIIVQELDVNIQEEDIKDDMPLYDEGLGLDSIAMINFIVLVEKRFNFTFHENEISAHLFSNINNLTAVVEEKLARTSEQNSATEKLLG